MKKILLLGIALVALSCSSDEPVKSGVVPNRLYIEEPAEGWHSTFISRDGAPFVPTTPADDDPQEIDVVNGDVIRVDIQYTEPFMLNMIAKYPNGAQEGIQHEATSGASIFYNVVPHE